MVPATRVVMQGVHPPLPSRRLPHRGILDVLRGSHSQRTPRLVLAVMLLHADVNGYVTAHQRDIAIYANLEKDSVRTAIRQLRLLGEVHTLHEGTRYVPSIWQIAALRP